ncbi:hypothetical protein [Caulobacter sp. 17J65-9]|uniref:hypothetical protein n=1 Tax=Caulobacter sp. 17J65-9 TaxID=2709382 RepID=UPI0013CC0627|nr:hypothetical protein [Caulobacter sp. 17J65-9]NEX91564.1 hypothetical protein [Caulobacter sp. 17J65-9]
MTKSLDEQLHALAQSEPDRSLAQLEPAVWARIGAREEAQPRPFGPLRVATVSLALVAGVAVGGAAATAAVHTPKEMQVFAVKPDLAPSTLLEGGR